MTTMIAPAAEQAPIENEELNEVQDAVQPDQDAQAKATSEKRRKYSGNDVLRLIRVLDEAKMDMDRQCLSMNDVVHLLQDRLDGMLKTRKCSCADLARLVTMAGFPVTERTLKDYLARSRKDAKEGKRNYSGLMEHILSQAGKEDGNTPANGKASFLPGEAGASGAKDAYDELAVPANEEPASAASSATSTATDGIEAKEMARQHVQDIYATRKHRKKARLSQKRK